MQKISMTEEYALTAMLYLSLHQNGGRSGLTVEEISKATGIPMNFLSKIMGRLGKAGLIRSSRGHKGSNMLSRPSNEISVLDIIEAVEGRISLNLCTNDPHACTASPSCPYYSMWIDAQTGLENSLKKHTLHSMAICIKGLPEEEKYFQSLRDRFSARAMRGSPKEPSGA